MSRRVTQEDVERFLAVADSPSESDLEYTLEFDGLDGEEIIIEIDLDDDGEYDL